MRRWLRRRRVRRLLLDAELAVELAGDRATVESAAARMAAVGWSK